jgi:hypothetical protein
MHAVAGELLAMIKAIAVSAIEAAARVYVAQVLWFRLS